MIEDEVARGRFRGYEQRAARRLRKLLPPEEQHGAESDVRFYALEAARLFDPDQGATFTTFLFKHLLNRTRAQVLKAWAKRRRPKGGFVELVGSPPCCAAPHSEILELRRSVSKPTREVLDLALEGNGPALQDAFCSRYYLARAEVLLGVPRKQVRDAVKELRRAIPKHITTIEEA